MSPLLAALDWVKLIQAVAWPIIALIGLILLFLTQQGSALLDKLPGRVKRVSAFGVELELNVETSTVVRENAEETFSAYRTRIAREFDRLIHINAVNDLRREVVENYVVNALQPSAKRTFRCTIHVPDVLFEEAMYQLLDYYPKGGGRGRAFSLRFGIVGRTWRLGDSQIQGSVDPGTRALVENWGMTSQEAAAAGQGRRSFASVLLRDDTGVQVAVFYIDAQEENAFGTEDQERDLAAAVEEGARENGLTAVVASVSKEMRQRGPSIRLLYD
jgi:hypothetical protein